MARRDESTYDFLSGGGEMGERIRRFDWSKTVLGPVEDWPQSLRSAVSILLPSKAQIVLFWGPEFITLYNDAYRPVLGGKHPRVLGLPGRETWKELWTTVLKDLFEGVINTGEAYWASDRPFFMERFEYDYKEETFFDVSYDPVRDESGKVGGVFCIVSETTTRVLGERRLNTLRELSARVSEHARSAEEACQAAARILSENRYDVPFASIYLLDPGGNAAQLAASVGIPSGSAAVPAYLQMAQAENHSEAWPLAKVLESGRPEVVKDLDRHFGALPGGAWPESPSTAVVLPLKKGSGQDRLAGFLIAGVSPRRPLDDQYRGFFDLLANQIATAVANARAYEEERKRAESLAALDRAKTVFFSNVSHEFRTPLTLMLDPLEEALRDSVSDHAPAHKERLEFAYRNSRRLLKLVNSLLDFARIEGGRIEASFEPTDLAEITADLAGVFRSATEQAQLTLDVDCPPLSEPVYVDRDMWEKIVLNLLSNAFKFTFQGGIAVTMREETSPVPCAVLRVQDTGTGIADDQLERIFERFHRIPGAKGRSIEGTGIGLALVKQLVQLHGGTIEVASTIDQGSTFTVRLPLGSAHLPQDHVRCSRYLAPTATHADVFAEEALRWVPSGAPHLEAGSATTEAQQSPPDASQPRRTILVADDNADMRAYVCRLLEPRYRVVSIEDGAAALERILAGPPDLVLADVMMPRLDGFGLVRELRRRPETTTIPVILLSARAGEESRIEGLERGADDYLIKPFTAKELLARVGAHLDLARSRREAEDSRLRLQKETQDALAQQRRLYESILTTTPDLAYVFDLNHRFVYANEGLLKMLGKTWDEAIGKTCLELGYEPWHAQMHDREIDQIIATRQPIRGEVPFTGTFGRRIYDYILTPVLSAEGRVIAVGGITRDVTDYRQAEHALRCQSQQFETLLNQSPLGVYLVDADFRLAQVNPLALPVFGDIPNLIGRDFEEVVHILWEQPYADELVMIFRHTLETGEPYLAPERIERRRDRGVIESYEWRVDRIVLPDGRFGVVCYFRDVSVQVLAREALRSSEERLREFAGQLEQLVAERTQELVHSQARLRALATELNLAEQRERKRLATELHDHLQQMLVLGKLKLGQGLQVADTGSRAREMIKQTDEVLGEALQYTRTLVAELSPPVLHEHGLAAGLLWLAQQMKRHDLAVTVRVPETEIALPEDQAVLLFQSVRELLINSSKHAQSNHAAIVLERADGGLRIDVSDNGIGFDVAAAAASPANPQSSKFGLFSIRERMKAMGGTFNVFSSPGQGTTATLSLPNLAMETPEADVEVGAAETLAASFSNQVLRTPGSVLQHKTAKVRLLLVDDHAMVREGLRSVLESYDDVEIVGEAANGEDALDLVERLRPALVIMDINMPKMTGIEATAQLTRTYPEIPVIGLSVNATGNNVQAMLKAGAVLLLTKEAAVNELYRRMREVLTMHAGSGSVSR